MSEADNAYQNAQKLIAEAKRDGGERLSFNTYDIRALQTLPPEIADLQTLRSLHLDNTQVSDLTPLAQITGLTELYLDNTQVSDLSPLTQNTGLTTLDLDNTKVSDLTPLAQIPGLATLDLDNTQVSDLTPLAKIAGLKSLDLDNTQVTDLSPLGLITGLARLDLNNTQVTDLAPIAGIAGLMRLALNNTQVTDLTPLAQNTGLTRLALGCTQVTDLAPLAQINGLATLILDNTQVNDLAPLAQIAGLTRLDLGSTQVTDLSPLAQITGLTALTLDNTQVTDLAPIAGISGLTTLNLGNTQVTDLAPIAGITGLTTLTLDNTPVMDLRPLHGMQKLKENPLGNGLTFKNSAAVRADPQIAQIAEIQPNKIRAAQLFAYLQDLQLPSELEDDGPQPNALLRIHDTDGRLEIAASHPNEAECDERLKQVLHTRLTARTTELAQLAGNKFFILCAKARSLLARLDRPFEDLDMLNIHLDVEELTSLNNRGAERDGDDPFPQEIANALSDVISIGPGLTLDNADVELLEDRKNRFAAGPPSPETQAAHDAMSEAVAENTEGIGDLLRALERQVLDREDDPAGAAVQDAAHRNILIRIGRMALTGVNKVAETAVVTIISTSLITMLATNWPTVVEVAGTYGPFFKTWFLTAMSEISELAALAQNVEMRPTRRPHDWDIDPE